MDALDRHWLAILVLDDGHGGFPLEQFHRDAFVVRVQVLDDHKSHAAVVRNVPQKLPQRLQAAGRSADTHDGERF